MIQIHRLLIGGRVSDSTGSVRVEVGIVADGEGSPAGELVEIFLNFDGEQIEFGDGEIFPRASLLSGNILGIREGVVEFVFGEEMDERNVFGFVDEVVVAFGGLKGIVAGVRGGDSSYGKAGLHEN